ncbi:cell wall hydrolase [Neobacillus niacini]|uniref:cell wall hydrolase n=1 Tax=Neobacillus niacini TaxID=86668 RepID=UPI0021CB7458|nr:cell wall hydrolase [Neobacillus niacini]MCM3764790.1 cell wall hydrolase [Neobacillus niacini]
MTIMLKSLIVACAATMAINIQDHTAKAITDNALQHRTSISVINPFTIGELYIQEDYTLHDAVQAIGDLFHPHKEVQLDSAKPVINAVVNAAVGVLADSSDQEKKGVEEKTETPNGSSESAETATEPVVTEVLDAQVTESADPVEQQMEPAETAETAVQEVEAPAIEPTEPAISISEQEKNLFARLVEAEAKGESYEGKVAVATVVLNRVESPEFPDTITEVIKEKTGKAYAFSPVQNGEINKPASEDSKQAVEEALKRENTLNNSIYFYNPEIATDTWIRTRQAVETIGNHVFAK